MKKNKFFITAGLALALLPGLQSCDDSDDVGYLWQPTALVTVYPQADESVLLQLDEATQLRPVNLKTSPFGNKVVRALVNYNHEQEPGSDALQDVTVNWIDSIRTKDPVVSTGEENVAQYGEDPIEIIRDWVTIAEDGYLTLRVRTVWGPGRKPHVLNLLTGVNPDNPMEFELRHDAKGDVAGTMGDALIAFNLNEVVGDAATPVRIKLRWKSFSGEKSTEFDLTHRNAPDATSGFTKSTDNKFM